SSIEPLETDEQALSALDEQFGNQALGTVAIAVLTNFDREVDETRLWEEARVTCAKYARAFAQHTGEAIAVLGLLAETVETGALTDELVGLIRDLSEMDPEEREDRLAEAMGIDLGFGASQADGEAATGSTSAPEGPRQTIERLLDLLGPYG